MFGRKFCGRDVDLFQLAQQALRLCELREDRFVRLGKFVRRGAGQFNQALAAAAQFVALLDFVFLVGDEVCRINFSDLMTKEIELLFARGFSRVERCVFGRQRL